MKYGMYAIRDQLVGYLSPSLAKNDDVAIRQFSMMINGDEGTLLATSPQYFDLYKVGEFDEEKGELIPKKPIELVVTGLSIKKGDTDNNGKKV